ncbi:hypothetical protein FSP39_014241 [Pinctada imbricata]|uniref:DNA-directed DNA polymerase n=1 Tax=Pinctada imbricata TaxID=66713 RepID=A0AA88XUU1_PINIB|nr:hypothetical protein FSP39_014241 [Pinctada imbricata]
MDPDEKQQHLQGTMSTSFLPSFMKICSVVLEKKSKMLKSLRRTTDAGRCAMTIAHLSFAQVLMNGAKIMTMSAHGVRFVDSYNFLPDALSRLPSAFGLTELKKGYFPHLFNTTPNQNYVGLYPPIETYIPNGMKGKAREEFLAWYQDKVQRREEFNFAKEMEEYCRSDVDILRRCCGKFRDTLLSLVKVDPFMECITFASTANLAFRRNFMPRETVAILPPEGYSPERKYSIKALRWLKWIAHETDHDICHARNGEEMKIAHLYVDGYNINMQTVYEFYGCFWHGCPECFSNMKLEEHPVRHDCTFKQLYQATQDRHNFLNEMGFRVEHIWEHEYDRRCKEDPEFGAFAKQMAEEIVDPLQPRDALFGGRTNATRLYCNEGDMRYIDVCFLYPSVLKHGTFPIGHPVLITENFDDIREYTGLVKCRIIPPRKLYHPVLPYRYGGKLLLPLCRTCVEMKEEIGPNYRCRHHENERALTGTWVIEEVKMALEMGYVLDCVHEVWNFPETSRTLFKDYIDTFLKIKQEASGYPPGCDSLKQKIDFVQEVFRREGIRLEDVEKNPVLRTIAKMFLNCLWGKFGQRQQLTQNRYLSDRGEVLELMQDDTKKVMHLELIQNQENDELDLILAIFSKNDDFVPPCNFGNVVIACYTTALARLKLYDALRRLDDRVLYFDTDSIIYVHDDHKWSPPS